MNEEKDELPDRIQQALKAQPERTPPESFYQAVLEKMDAPHDEAREAPALRRPGAPARWRIPAVTLATACVVMIIVLVEKKAERPSKVPPVEQPNAGTRVFTAEKIRSNPVPAAAPAFSDKLEKRSAPPVKQDAAEIDARLLDQEISEQVTAVLQSRRDVPPPPAAYEATVRKGAPLNRSQLTSRGHGSALVAGNAAPSAELSGVQTASAPLGIRAKELERPGSWSGHESGVTRSRNVVIRDAAAWRSLWNEHAPGSRAPEINFTREIVVGIFLGERPTLGYSVEITDIRTLPDQLAVEYQENLPEEGKAYGQEITAPFVLKVIPKTDLFIHFHPLRPRSR